MTQEMLVLVTPNRLNNVISKFGRVAAMDRKKQQQLVELLVRDVLETFDEEYESLFSVLSVDSQQIMMERLQQASPKLVDDYFIK
ncbi:MAG: hypothetical protein ACHBN1_22845 [Heteroscytonema crispum UTEX LB 1556]